MSTTSTAIFFLGAIDPEMFTISRLLTEAGVEWEWAMSPAAAARYDDLVHRAIDAQNCGEPEDVWRPLFAEAGSLAATPLRAPAEAYGCADITGGGTCPTCYGCGDVAEHGGTCLDCGGRRRRTIVWVECRPAGMSRAALEARGDYVIDHHDTANDPMATTPPERAVEASSIGQVFALAARVGALASLRDVMSEGDAVRPDLRIAGALDHCLHAALGGLVPGVDRDAALRAAAKMAANGELSALVGRPPEAATPEAFIAQVEAAQATLRAAPRVIFGGQEVCDLLSHTGKVPSLPVAAAHAGTAYVVEAPARPGVPTTCTIGGAATPAAVRVFAEVAREAFAEALAEARSDAALDAARLETHEATLAYGRVREMEAHADKGAARGGVYAFPERGMAAVYLPAEALARFLRDPVERGFADLLVGDSALGHCLALAAEHPTASGAAMSELRALREAARAAGRRIA